MSDSGRLLTSFVFCVWGVWCWSSIRSGSSQHLEMGHTFRSEDPDLNTMASVSSCVRVNPGGAWVSVFHSSIHPSYICPTPFYSVEMELLHCKNTLTHKHTHTHHSKLVILRNKSFSWTGLSALEAFSRIDVIAFHVLEWYTNNTNACTHTQCRLCRCS